MKFEIFSRQKAKKFSYHQDIEDCIIISITDCFSKPNTFASNPHIKGILKLQFDDVDFGQPNCITEKDSKEIINFVNKFIDKVKLIVVHCEAGVSRSAGVCAALMKIINDDDMPIFTNPRFCPNMSCYRSIMKTYYGSYDKEKADDKISRNIRVWKQYNDLD